jgi:nucleoside-diphosphate-sugar epimerase
MNYSILGCGWLGFPLAQHFIANKNTVYGSTTSSEKLELFSDSNITPFLIKIDNNEIEGEIDTFLESDTLIIDVPFGKQKENFKGYQTLAFLIEKSSIKKVIFISSSSVYSDTNGIITEDDDFIVNPPKQGLVDLENLFLHQKGFETIVIRFSGLIGGNRNPGNFFKEGRIVKNGLAPINLIHLEDCIEIIHRISNSKLRGHVFNASADTHPTRKEFYTAASISNGNIPAAFLTNKDFSYKIISSKKLKNKLNYQFKHADLLKLL